MRRLLALLMLTAGFVCTSCGPGAPEASSAVPVPDPTPVPTPSPAPVPTPPFPVSRSELTVTAPDGTDIGGVLYTPKGLETAPLILCAHGLGADHESMEYWAEELSRLGLAAFCFDFRGTGGLSGGSETEMSVLTEAEDVLALLDAAQAWPGIDADRVVLLGESQGGFACAIAAGRQPKSVAGMILLYPAFVIPDHIRAMFPDAETIPEVVTDYLWVTVGRRYALDMLDYDAYNEIAGYSRPVLIIHGSEDTLVPVSYSERAASG